MPHMRAPPGVSGGAAEPTTGELTAAEPVAEAAPPAAPTVTWLPAAGSPSPPPATAPAAASLLQAGGLAVPGPAPARPAPWSAGWATPMLAEGWAAASGLPPCLPPKPLLLPSQM